MKNTWLTLALVCLLAPGSGAEAADPPADADEAALQAARDRAQQEAQRRAADPRADAIERMPATGPVRLRDLVDYRLDDGRLVGRWTGKLPAGNTSRLQIEGSDALWTLTRTTYRTALAPGAPPVITRESCALQGYWRDQAAGDGIHAVSLSITDDTLSVSAHFGARNPLMTVSFIQRPHRAALRAIGRDANNRTVLNLQAPTLLELQRANPAEVRQHLLPVFRLVGADRALRPGAADVYRLFGQIPPDPAIAARVRDLLPRLGADFADDRDAASVALQALGRPGVLAVLRRDWGPLTQEQRNRLNLFLLDHTHRQWDDPDAVRQDLLLLADCLEDDDARVRAAARDALAQALGHSIDIDPAAPPDTLSPALDALRRQLHARPTPSPATAPAD